MRLYCAAERLEKLKEPPPPTPGCWAACPTPETSTNGNNYHSWRWRLSTWEDNRAMRGKDSCGDARRSPPGSARMETEIWEGQGKWVGTVRARREDPSHWRSGGSLVLRRPPGRGRWSQDGNFPHDAFRVPLKTERPVRRPSSSDLRCQRWARRAELNHANWFVQQYSSSNLIVALCPSSLSIFFPGQLGCVARFGPPGAQCLRFVVSSISKTTSHFTRSSESRSL